MHGSKVITFVGSSLSQGDIFFLKSDLNWPFFTYCNILESHVINLRGQENLKTQKLYKKWWKSRSQSIYVHINVNVHFKKAKNWLFHSICIRGLMVRTEVCWPISHEFEPWSGLFTFFFKVITFEPCNNLC